MNNIGNLDIHEDSDLRKDNGKANVISDVSIKGSNDYTVVATGLHDCLDIYCVPGPNSWGDPHEENKLACFRKFVADNHLVPYMDDMRNFESEWCMHLCPADMKVLNDDWYSITIETAVEYLRSSFSYEVNHSNICVENGCVEL